MTDATFDSMYKLGKTLGEGAFAEVKIATKNDSKDVYAVKIVDRKRLSEDDEECLQIEINNLTALQHPNIIRLFKVFHEPLKYYLVMELVKGGELFDRVVSKNSYTEQEGRDACKTVFEAIGYCHKNCIAHRDLKPENLLLMYEDSDTEIKIADFGFSKHVESPEANCLTTRCGTPEYVAPEVLSGRPYSSKCDTWSLGVIIYILLCGYPPFYDDNVRRLFRQILKANYKFHDDTWGDVSDEAKDLISKLLVVKANKRLSADEVLQHEWFANASLSGRDLDKAKDNLKSFQKNKRFKAAANAIIVTNRLASMVGAKAGAQTFRNKRTSIPHEALDLEDLAKLAADIDEE